MTGHGAVRVGSILAPIDESPGSTRAVRLAIEIARAFGSELILFHVAPLRELPVLIGEAEDFRDSERGQLVLGRAAKMAAEAGVRARVELRQGHVVDQILRCVRRDHPDLIVMGSRGIRGAKGVLLGSVSRAVSRKSSASVVLVR